MSEGAGRERWQHTSSILCMMANNARDPKKTKAFKPEQFDPYAIAERKERRRVADPESLELLRDTLIAWKGQKKNG